MEKLGTVDDDNTRVSLSDKGIVEINTWTEGSSHDETTSKWRMNSDDLELIGYEGIFYDGLAFARDSKNDPIKTKLSINFLTAKVVEIREFKNGSEKKKNCTFNKRKFKNKFLKNLQLPKCF